MNIKQLAAAAALLPAMHCAGFSGSGTTNLVDGVFVVTVPSGGEANLQGTDATVANDANAPIAKRGAGVVYSGSGFGSFVGEFRVEEGTLGVNSSASLGTTDGGTTISNGAVLMFRSTENYLSYPGEAIALAGKIQNSSQKPMLDAFPGAITVLGDNATFDGYPIGLCGTLALDGHTLTVGMNKSSYLLLRDVEVLTGGTIRQTQGGFRLEGTTLLSARETYNFPNVEVQNGGSLENNVFGYGGNIASLTKTGDNVFTFDSSLAVTGETYIAQGTLKLGGSAPGTAGLTAAVTNFNKNSNAEWLSFVGAANVSAVPNLSNAAFMSVATNLLAIGEEMRFASTELSPTAAYNSWSSAEVYKLGAYRGYFWNNDATNKVVTFATSIADTALVWINGKIVVRNIGSKKDAGGATYFATLGEATLKPGPNEFIFLLGHFNSGSKGPRSDVRPAAGLNWAENCGIMYREGSYAITNSADFVQLVDSGDGSLLTLTKQPPAALAPAGATYMPRFDALRFAAGCTLDLGGLVNFPQNGLAGCPCVTNGSMVLSGAWRVAKADLDVHPLEVAVGAGVTFDNATLEISAAGLERSGVTVLHAAAGATVAGMPTPVVSGDGRGRWVLRRVESGGETSLVLHRIPPGAILTIR